MPGDWSSPFVDSSHEVQGQHALFGYDPEWTVTSDFVFNAATNQTVFSLDNPNYAGADSSHDGPYPGFALVGPVVPEPSPLMLSGVGLALGSGCLHSAEKSPASFRLGLLVCTA